MSIDKTTLNFQLPVTLKARLVAEAQRQYVTPGTLARILLAHGLESGVTARAGDILPGSRLDVRSEETRKE